MKRLLTIILTTAALLAATGAAQGAVYYVATTGFDTNTGTEALPWRTIQKAVDTANPGDTIIVMPGNYDRTYIKTSGVAGYPITIKGFTSPDKSHVNMRELYDPHNPKLNIGNPNLNAVSRGFVFYPDWGKPSIKYIRIENFEITNIYDPAKPFPQGGGIYLGGRSDAVTIENIEIVNNFLHDLNAKPPAERESFVNGIWGANRYLKNIFVKGNTLFHTQGTAINVMGDTWLVEDNDVSHTLDTNTDSGATVNGDSDALRILGTGHVIRGNYLHDCLEAPEQIGTPHIDGIQIFSEDPGQFASQILIENNYIYNVGQGFIGTDTTELKGGINAVHDITLRNNVIRKTSGVGLNIGVDYFTLVNNAIIDTTDYGIEFSSRIIDGRVDLAHHALISNNIVYGSNSNKIGWRGIYYPLSNQREGSQIDYNMYYPNFSPWPSQPPEFDLHSNFGSDPKFLNYNSGDFHLTSESTAAIDAGVDLSLTGFSTDKDGVLRPRGAGWDIGAYEYRPWQFDWNARTDRYGKPAGIFDVTPFPIDENTASYSVKNDEYPDGKTYYLGAKYYVDGGYDGRNGAGDGSWERPFKTINEALVKIAAGNVTIIIRGAHDGFDGVYNEVGLSPKSGLDDAHRFIITGYGQERPVVNGSNTGQSTIEGPYSVSLSYITIQRLKIQDNFRQGIYFKGKHSRINVIDVWLYNNDRWDPNKPNSSGGFGGTHGDGNLYFLGSDNCWIFHASSERSGGHGFKVGDDADNVVLEWSAAKESGWWEGTPYADYSQPGATPHPTSFDFPAAFGESAAFADEDGDGNSDYNDNLVVRYNVCGSSLYSAVQLRRCPNFDFHHNEVYGSPHFSEVRVPDYSGVLAQVFIGGDKTYGKFYANIIRDPGSGKSTPMYPITAGAGAVWISRTSNSAGDVYLYNNLVYGHNEGASITIPYHTTSGPNAQGLGNIHIFNNSIYSSNNSRRYGTGVLTIDSTVWYYRPQIEVKNNIIYLDGEGRSTEWYGRESEVLRSNNIYYHPRGLLGFTSANLDQSEAEVNPLWRRLPSGFFQAGFGEIEASSPARDAGIDLSTLFNVDLKGILRSQGAAWDIGAYEYVEGGAAVSYGDVSGEGSITAYDAALALQLGRGELEAGQIAERAVGLQ